MKKYIITGKLKILYKKFLSDKDKNTTNSIEIVNFLLDENTKMKKQLMTQELDHKKVLDKIKKG